MAEYRFKVGTTILCNLGGLGWRPGRIIALNYRESNWPEGEVAPYQVALEEDYSLIYVPEDSDRFCRETTPEDRRVLARKDALAEYQTDNENSTSQSENKSNLCCSNEPTTPRYQSYRKGRCFCCDDCPRDWSYAELYSEHYRCAEKNNLKVTRHEIDLGVFSVGDNLNHKSDAFLLNKSGFNQAPTLVRLPPGVLFSDDGTLAGEIRHDPHRGINYDVDFVAVSTAEWDNESIGLVRLEIRFKVEGNHPPDDFDVLAFQEGEEEARLKATNILKNLNQTWTQWEGNLLGNRATCDGMLSDLNRLRVLLESHPRLDNGKWWGHLGGYHMNVHKLLENTLFECELYLGYALTFGDDEVRYYAEQNLRGCFSKRLLEAARFMWYDGTELLLRNEWTAARDIFRLASAKKDGWGWAVNYGDIWLSEAVALMMSGVETNSNNSSSDENQWIKQASELIGKARLRSDESGVFGTECHPWVNEVSSAIESYKDLISSGESIDFWLEEFSSRTIYWCSQILAGSTPFPPQQRKRLALESTLIDNLPKHNS